MEEPVLRSRLLPQLSIRSILGLTFIMAILATIARSAGAGEEAAIAFLFAASTVIAYFAGSVLLFLLARTINFLFPQHLHLEEQEDEPAVDCLPPQILPPRDHRT